MPYGTGGEAVKKASAFTLKHLAQAIGSILVVAAATWAFAEPAVKQYVENTVSKPLTVMRAEQKVYRSKQNKRWEAQTKVLNSAMSKQSVIIEKQRVQERMQTETRSDIKELLRRVRPQ